MNGPERGRLVPELGRDLFRKPVLLQVGREPLRPVVAPPDALALLVVGGALKHRRPGEPLHVFAPARVIGVEVRHEDRVDVDLAQDRRPALLCVGQSEPGVDQRPAVVIRKQVAVNVPDPEWERERQSPDAAR
jgi:hypothetical protein